MGGAFIAKVNVCVCSYMGVWLNESLVLLDMHNKHWSSGDYLFDHHMTMSIGPFKLLTRRLQYYRKGKTTPRAQNNSWPSANFQTFK